MMLAMYHSGWMLAWTHQVVLVLGWRMHPCLMAARVTMLRWSLALMGAAVAIHLSQMEAMGRVVGWRMHPSPMVVRATTLG